jgi:hypothetical protein
MISFFYSQPESETREREARACFIISRMIGGWLVLYPCLVWQAYGAFNEDYGLSISALITVSSSVLATPQRHASLSHSAGYQPNRKLHYCLLVKATFVSNLQSLTLKRLLLSLSSLIKVFKLTTGRPTPPNCNYFTKIQQPFYKVKGVPMGPQNK